VDGLEADVCVVGAGYAGLTAARRMQQAGKAVVVLEARARVGGRVWTNSHDGIPIDLGGTFLAPGHDAIRGLAAELGVGTHPTNTAGKHVLVHDGRVSRYRGLFPRISPVAIASLGLNMARLDAMAKKVSLDEPWTGRRARDWDARSAGAWLADRVHVPLSRSLLEASVRGLWTCDPSEVSLLHVLYLIRSAGGLNVLLSTKGGYQQDQVDGGMQTMANRMAAELGDAVCLDVPVRAIFQTDGNVRVEGDGTTVRARRVVVAVPPALAANITYDPPLPVDRAQVLERMPAGSMFKAAAVYDRPFWRDDGLCGESVSTKPPIETSYDCSPPSGDAGIIMGFAFGPYARDLSRLSAGERRTVVLDTYRERFGLQAGSPLHYVDHDWAEEEWTRGCSAAHLPPGILTQYGHVLRTPCGRIHWAGSETATVSHAAIDGAVRSGERAAQEVLAEP